MTGTPRTRAAANGAALTQPPLDFVQHRWADVLSEPVRLGPDSGVEDVTTGR